MTEFILSIDQGTTGTTALLLDCSNPMNLRIISQSTETFPQYYPQAGWVEHDLNEIWKSVELACKKTIEQALQKTKRFSVNQIAAIGLTNQRETLCAYDQKTLMPECKAIVWQCRRSTQLCSNLKKAGYEAQIAQKTGLLIDPYFTGSKIAWLANEYPNLKKKVHEGAARIGTIDTFLISRLTQGASYKTEPSNAARTLLFDIEKGRWDRDLAKLFGLEDVSFLPEVVDSASSFGKTSGLNFLPDGIPITGVLGDQQAALAGQACLEPGEAKCTYGTGAFLLVNIGEQPREPAQGTLCTVAWQLNGKRSYAFEGSAFVAGAALQFLRDNFGFFTNVSETQALAAQAKAAPGLYFIPAFTGLGAPWWNPQTRGSIFGLTRGTTKEQITRAALEGVAFQVSDLMKAMGKNYSDPIISLRTDGGASANDLLMQTQANFLDLTIERPKQLETTAIGSGLFAALGAGIFNDVSEIKGATEYEKVFYPTQVAEEKLDIKRQLKGWLEAVRASQNWTPPL